MVFAYVSERRKWLNDILFTNTFKALIQMFAGPVVRAPWWSPPLTVQSRARQVSINVERPNDDTGPMMVFELWQILSEVKVGPTGWYYIFYFSYFSLFCEIIWLSIEQHNKKSITKNFVHIPTQKEQCHRITFVSQMVDAAQIISASASLRLDINWTRFETVFATCGQKRWVNGCAH